MVLPIGRNIADGVEGDAELERFPESCAKRIMNDRLPEIYIFTHSINIWLGSGLIQIQKQIQKAMIEASMTADRKLSVSLCGTRRKSLRRQKAVSIRQRSR
jgi:hypothetical protein